ncbi:ABC transporter substrate-binding protein [Paenibacillus sp. Soil787]|uniref:ABC transporter substrate-binding protein n=1 Tax=Paenibacillus sp. Soil787 TaxID=1736411 RepID=UPI0006FFA615|nr:ABC transporter substrate-binding protein [Paenibacillus sp. Soil787]KRF42287.1 ABC transporter substrate-binding protein [Paenibacillus sp. Soil787]
MKRKLKSVSLLLLATMMTTVVAACSKSGESSPSSTASSAAPTAAASKTPDPGTLKVMLFGEKPADMDKVLAEFEKRTKDTLNTKLDISFDVFEQYKTKMKLKMTAGEDVDLMFDAPWANMVPNISQGYYQELDQYFNNDAYPGLKKAFTPEFLESNKVNGHIYGVPITNAFSDIEAVFIRKDLREKYGLKPIQSYDDLKVYYDKVKENDPKMVPYPGGRDGWYRVFQNFKDKQTNFRSNPYDVGGTSTPFNIVLSQDGKKVLGATTIGDPNEDYAKLPAPFNNPDYFYNYLDKRVEFRQYLPKDAGAAAAGAAAAGVVSASDEGNLSNAAKKLAEWKKVDPKAEMEIFVYNDAARDMKPGAIGTDHKAWNFLVVPKNSKNIDRTMKYLDWLYSNPDNHDLFELGIEGEHWTKDGDGKYKGTANSKNYVFPGYELSWNPSLSRVNSENEAEVLKYIAYQSKNESYYSLALRGFTFNSEPVKTEMAKVQPKYDVLKGIVVSGLDPNWKQNAAEVNKELRSLGLEKIRAELLKQVQAYLDAGGK